MELFNNRAGLIAAAVARNPIDVFAIEHAAQAGNGCGIIQKQFSAVRAIIYFGALNLYCLTDFHAADNFFQLFIIKLPDAVGVCFILIY